MIAVTLCQGLVMPGTAALTPEPNELAGRGDVGEAEEGWGSPHRHGMLQKSRCIRRDRRDKSPLCQISGGFHPVAKARNSRGGKHS